MSTQSQLPGGFDQPSLPSPSPSTISQSSTSRSTLSPLPHPRSHPLRPGSSKETAARNFVENKLLYVSRRYVKKFQAKEDEEDGEKDVKGYEGFGEVARDLNEVIDVLWLSGTPSLQVSYFLSIALAITSYMASFPAAPDPTFSLLRKVDHAFASLIQGRDIVTGDVLPGAAGSTILTRTDMIRCRSLVESTRVLIVDIMSGEIDVETEAESGTETEADNKNMRMFDTDQDDENGIEMNIAKAYERTLEQLNIALGGDAEFEAGGGRVESASCSFDD